MPATIESLPLRTTDAAVIMLVRLPRIISMGNFKSIPMLVPANIHAILIQFEPDSGLVEGTGPVQGEPKYMPTIDLAAVAMPAREPYSIMTAMTYTKPNRNLPTLAKIAVLVMNVVYA